MAAGVCWLTQGQGLDVVGFNMTAIRLLLLVGLIRVVGRRESSLISPNAVDKCFVAYVFCISIVGVLRGAAIAYQCGVLYDALLPYIIFRSLVSSLEEFLEVLKFLPAIIFPVAVLMVNELLSHHNLFAALGGASAEVWIRDGSVRSMGPFRNPITAGSLGATLAPLFVGLIFSRSAPKAGVVGVALCAAIVITSHSSGPLLTSLAVILGLALWCQRENMRLIRWMIVVALVAAHLTMNAPVWFLIGRASDIAGGGGYHRAYLIDRFINFFDSWWLLGTSDTSNWMPTQLSFGGADITNRFVADGIGGGLLGLALSIALIALCFRNVGRSIREAQQHFSLNREKFLWCLGITLFAHVVNQFSVTYFDQMYVMWYSTLAVISSITAEQLQDPDPASDAESVNDTSEASHCLMQRQVGR